MEPSTYVFYLHFALKIFWVARTEVHRDKSIRAPADPGNSRPPRVNDPFTPPSRVARFFRRAKGYWADRGGASAWLLTASLIAVVFASLGITYSINRWHRLFFDALEAKNAAVAFHQALLFPVLVELY